MFFVSPFFFHDPATTEIYTLSLHDALPISREVTTTERSTNPSLWATIFTCPGFTDSLVILPEASVWWASRDRKSTRLNSSHSQISYAVFCLKKKKKKIERQHAHYETSTPVA